ncbi:hypothetical protein EWB00_000732 [Schistosoma japonicum]|uniref:Uncharacterized protein n=1 Tax=Schistosoma japonicum TaxID=6182 RepID=A0A4Z2DX36_SCHJA|nr:hypothetical protein EWB00_000732 [Schistosoma japonicum]TNN21112.1 hypothetical protein EWB00_000732 [Schistosoma japonicum]
MDSIKPILIDDKDSGLTVQLQRQKPIHQRRYQRLKQHVLAEESNGSGDWLTSLLCLELLYSVTIILYNNDYALHILRCHSYFSRIGCIYSHNLLSYCIQYVCNKLLSLLY